MTQIAALDFELTPLDNQQLSVLCGSFERNLRQIECRLGVEINNRTNQFKVLGSQKNIELTRDLLNQLYLEASDPGKFSAELIHLALAEITANTHTEPKSQTSVVIKTKRGVIRPRGAHQQDYVCSIQTNDIAYGIGPAGTGKTYLAVACAVDSLERQEIRRIILTRPAVEAGERLGFLPGDLAQKVDPYLRPLYDALYEMLGFEKVAKLIERNVIEVAPLAYMRGRTLNDAFIILDEGQNTTKEQMKMFLTRIGFNSRAVITGDITQIDLPNGQNSGLRHAIEVLSGVKNIAFTFFQSGDVVRHHVVQSVVEAYEKFDLRRESPSR